MMKNLRNIFILTVLTLGLNTVGAQVILDCESGSHAIEKGNCWDFGAMNYVKADENVISGDYSAKSYPMTKMDIENSYLKTPWMKVNSGNITFQAKLDNNSGTSKEIILSYIRYDINGHLGEATPVHFYTYSYPKINNLFVTSVQNIVVPVPETLYTAKEAFRIQLSFVGENGTNRTYMDNLSVPGEYWCDPSEKCLPLAWVNTEDKDSDDDGVNDNQDEFPEDKNISYNNFIPAENIFGTIAFEDSWPSKGDYDLNDLVVNFNINRITNSSNQVTEIRARFVSRASGATFRNAFGFQIDSISSDAFTSVENSWGKTNDVFQYGANGLESGQTFANCIVFDDFYKIMQHPGGGTGINTDKNAPFVPYDTINIVMKLKTPLSIQEFSAERFNFYMVSNVLKSGRGREIHMPDAIPSSLIDEQYYGKSEDNSNTEKAGSKRKNFFRTKRNLPWAITILQGFDYPVERASVDKAYKFFIKWAESGGEKFTDWYSNKDGYRDTQYIY